MIRISYKVSKQTIKPIPTSNKLRTISTTLKSQVRKGLFEELFPLATKIDPTTSSFIAIEPIEGTHVEGTIFTNKKESLSELYGATNKKKRITIDEKIENLLDNKETKFQVIDQVAGSGIFSVDEDNYGIFESEFQDEDNYGIYGGEESLEERDADMFTVEKRRGIAHLQESLDQYIEHFNKHYEKPNHMSFIITDTPDATENEIVESIQNQIELPITSIVLKKSLDRTTVGKNISTFVSLMLNSENDDLTIDTSFYYNRFSNFGLSLNGIRHQVVKSHGLKTIEIKIHKDVDSKELKEELVKELKDRIKDIESVKVSLSKPVYDPFEMVPHKNRGYANLSFKSHIDAIQALELSKRFSLRKVQARPNLSRYLFADTSDSSILIKTLSKKKAKQNQEIELMRKMIDIKEKVKLLESNLKEIRSMNKNNKSKLQLNNNQNNNNSLNNNNNNNNNNINNSFNQNQQYNINNSFNHNNNSSDAIDNNNHILKMKTI